MLRNENLKAGSAVQVFKLHPQKDVPVGRAVDTVKKIRLELK
jgi:hypothetical protein